MSVLGGKMEEARRGTPILPCGKRLCAVVLRPTRALQQPDPDQGFDGAHEGNGAELGKSVHKRLNGAPTVEEMQNLASERGGADPGLARVILEYQSGPPPVGDEMRRAAVQFLHSDLRSPASSDPVNVPEFAET